jgi:hypothetical protein
MLKKSLFENSSDSERVIMSALAADKTPLFLFWSYAHEDETLRDELDKHLAPLKRQGLLSTWYDRKIGAGREWEGLIDANLERADIILLLVSHNFLASDYCYDKEMARAAEARGW